MQTREQVLDGWMPMRLFPPMSCETYEVKLADGAVRRAFWSGKAWWLQGVAITPMGWRVPEVVAA